MSMCPAVKLNSVKLKKIQIKQSLCPSPSASWLWRKWWKQNNINKNTIRIKMENLTINFSHFVSFLQVIDGISFFLNFLMLFACFTNTDKIQYMMGNFEIVFVFYFLMQIIYQATCIRKKPVTVLAVKKMNVWFAYSVIKSSSPVFFTIQCKSPDIIMGFQVL